MRWSGLSKRSVGIRWPSAGSSRRSRIAGSIWPHPPTSRQTSSIGRLRAAGCLPTASTRRCCLPPGSHSGWLGVAMRLRGCSARSRLGQNKPHPLLWYARLLVRGVERYRRGALAQAQEDLESAVNSARGELWEMFVDDRRGHLLRVYMEPGAFDATEASLQRWGTTAHSPKARAETNF